MKRQQGLFLLMFLLSAVSYAQQRYEVTVVVNQPAMLQASAGNDISKQEAGSISLGGDPSASGGTPPYAFAWSPNTSIDNPSIGNPTITTSSTISETYTLTVTDARGCSASDEVSVEIIVTSAENLSEVDYVYPNPANRSVTIRAKHLIQHWQVIDSQSREILHGDHDSRDLVIDVSALLSGVYIIELQTQQGKIKNRLIVKR